MGSRLELKNLTAGPFALASFLKWNTGSVLMRLGRATLLLRDFGLMAYYKGLSECNRVLGYCTNRAR